MNDASDAQEDFRFAVTDKDQKGAVEALAKLEGLMSRRPRTTGRRRSRMTASSSRKRLERLAAQAGTAAKAGNLPLQRSAFDKMGASCNSCHELHLEKK